MQWSSPSKPAEITEKRLIDAILDELFPPDSSLPAERELAQQLGVTRPTLREALQRLARDGWVEIRQGKPTRVKNYLEEGSLGVLSALADRSQHLPDDFIPDLLAVRLDIAPAYTRLAVERNPKTVCALLEKSKALQDLPESYALYDWEVHHKLTVMSKNPIYTLILNGFAGLYQPMACQYFQNLLARRASLAFYKSLLKAAEAHDPNQAEEITRRVMEQSLSFWSETTRNQDFTEQIKRPHNSGGEK